MPKEIRGKIPYPAPYQTGSSSSSNPNRIHSTQTRPEPVITQKDKKDWDEARCPVCMDHPHNAVLLECNSKQNGCKPFMCNTSYRHSNCLDQFNKSNDNNDTNNNNNEGEEKDVKKLCCPLCRGSVTGYIVEEPARNYMNSKLRSCSSESCEFNGTYAELRKHAREAHPDARPSEANPDRLRDWRRMERERDLGDLFSVLVEDSEEGGRGGGGDRERFFAFPNFAIFLIVHVLGEEGEGNGSRNNRSGNERGIGEPTMRVLRRRRRVLWGEGVNEFNAEFGFGNSNNVEESIEEEEEEEEEEVGRVRRSSTREWGNRRYIMEEDDDESEL